jgi:hypothetical protein
MLRNILVTLAFSVSFSLGYAQLKVGDNPLSIDDASLIEIESTSKGFLPSRMTSAQRDLQLSWNQGHIVYNTTDSCLQIYNGLSWDCLNSIDTSLFTYNGSLTSARTLALNSYSLTFDGTLGDIIITSNGELGIGDLTPEAMLDVEGGTVRFSDYGSGANAGTLTYVLGVDAEGDVIEVDGSSLGTDNQVVDTFSLTSNILSISLEDDGETAKTIDLSGYLDDINIYEDNGTLTANRTIATGGFSLQFSHLGNVTTFDPSGTDLTISSTLTADVSISSNSKTLDLSVTPGSSADALITADNGIDDLIITNTNTTAGSDLQLGTSNETKLTIASTGQLNLKEYGTGTFDDSSPSRLLGVQSDGDIVDVDPNGVGTDDQVIDTLSLNANTLSLSLEGDGEAAKTVDLSSFLDNTDDQVVDDFSISSNTLSLSLENDGQPAQTVDLSPYLDDVNLYDDDGSLSGNRTVTLNGNNLTFDGTGTGDVTIESDGDVGIGDTTPDARLDVEGGSVRFSDYGIGTYVDSNAAYIAGIDTLGNIIELNTFKNTKWFYAPAVTIDASSTGSGLTLDLHQEYVNQFTSPSVSSPGAPVNIPYYNESELYYFVTYYDNTILSGLSISSTGVLTYNIDSVPSDNYTVINVVFLIK